MSAKGIPYSIKEKSISLLLITTLLWLTTSLPFISQAQNTGKLNKEVAGQTAQAADDNTNPLTGNTDEKATSGGINSLSEEYLHHPEELVALIAPAVRHCTIHLIGFYETFHGELLFPPPNC